MSLRWITVFSVLLLLFILGTVRAQDFRLANMFEDGMILQMEPKRSQIAGFGAPGETITVIMDGGAIEVDSTVADDSTWNVLLPPQPPGGPHDFTIENAAVKGDTKETLTLNDVLFGDVWLCAGEGNMEFEMRNIFNATEEMDKALQYTQIRVMQVGQYASDIEENETAGLSLSWTTITPESVGGFPAVCLLYAERLADILDDRPFGLMAVTWQDTPIESWVSKRVTNFCETPAATEAGEKDNNAIWNGMIHPLTRMAVRGAVFAQGESNVFYNSDLYVCHFLQLTQDWRNTFVDGTVNVTKNGWSFPFGFLQLGAMETDDHESVFVLRKHQTMDTHVAPNGYANETFMGPAYDLYDQDSPLGSMYYRDKQTVSARLANCALRLMYNETQHHFMGPTPTMNWNPNTLIMNVSYSWDVVIKNGPGDPSGFSYFEDGKWIDAPLLDVSDNSIEFIVGYNYTHVAYAWNSIPCQYKECNVYDDLPDALPHIAVVYPNWEEQHTRK